MTDTIARNRELRLMLTERQRQMQDDVRQRIHRGRTRRMNEVSDALEHSDEDVQDGMELALLQMRSEALIRVGEALARLDAGSYGSCYECAADISSQRLRALPFAVRCQACEERREHEQANARQSAQRGVNFAFFPEAGRL